ncbi:leucine-rich repeat and fibronectin type-III domain-containing protein 5 [Biomphalaria glabrata]|nr:leucine-rich repeat and fibronectin type-III domain-containing protein 5 [Biomphalaria glabrata]
MFITRKDMRIYLSSLAEFLSRHSGQQTTASWWSVMELSVSPGYSGESHFVARRRDNSLTLQSDTWRHFILNRSVQSSCSPFILLTMQFNQLVNHTAQSPC